MKRMRLLSAWLLYGLALYLALSFATFDSIPESVGGSRLTNLGGAPGRFLAGILVEAFGVGAFAFSFYLVLVGYLLQTARPARLRIPGLLGLIICMFTLGAFWQAILPARGFPGGSVPLGGILGFEVSLRLRALVGLGWSLAALGIGGLAGLLLATDELVPEFLWRSLRGRGGESRARLRRVLGRSLEAMIGSGQEGNAEDVPVEKRGPAAPVPRRRRARSPEAPAEAIPPSRRQAGEPAAVALEEEDEFPEDVVPDELPESDDCAEADDEENDRPETREVPSQRQPPRIREAFSASTKDGIEVIRLAPDPKLRGKETYPLPPLSLLAEPTYLEDRETEEEIQGKASAVEQALLDFGITARVEEVERGPVITRFDLSIARGTKISKVTGLADELAMALGVARVRVAPVKGRSVLGVEVPNRERETVFLRELALSGDLRRRKVIIPLFLGKDASGHPILEDLATTPHLLIAGRTGAGKSVFVNSVVLSILLTRYPEEVRLIMIDPKKVELEVYQEIPHLLTKVESNPKKAAKILEWAVNQMEERYELLAATGVRHLTSYNRMSRKSRLEKLSRLYSPEEAEKLPEHLPYIVILVDELADLMMASGKEVEQAIARLAQKARAVGIHVVLATQRPSTDVITGLIKSNLPARIAFQTRTGVDSRTILDRYGAEKLLDKGDMLYLSATSDDPRRIQGPLVSDIEVERVVTYLKEKASPLYASRLEQVQAPAREAEASTERDELFEQAVDVVMTTGQASASFLQRRMQVGYARASRLIDLMAEAGFVSESKGSKAREILLTPEKWEEMRSKTAEASP